MLLDYGFVPWVSTSQLILSEQFLDPPTYPQFRKSYYETFLFPFYHTILIMKSFHLYQIFFLFYSIHSLINIIPWSKKYNLKNFKKCEKHCPRKDIWLCLICYVIKWDLILIVSDGKLQTTDTIKTAVYVFTCFWVHMCVHVCSCMCVHSNNNNIN